ncbi:MAG: Gfo/Idh/MocA family oxidoreductase [Candidatus Brocadiae bacterium]|nr:Gfo/Idh/MocA family oxidoreductase [Candidatus Brocadiia bacterium]
MSQRNVTRRSFLAQVASVAAPYVLTSTALGAGGKAAASDRIVVGAIGTGGRGMGLLGMNRYPNCSIAAVCDVFEPHLARAQKAIGGTCEAVADFRRIIDRTDVDAVTIGTPDHWHALITIMGCQSGKDVYCEKPLSRTAHEGREMVKAARRYGRVVQMGTQHRSRAVIRQVCEWVRNGRLGKVEKVRLWVWRNRQQAPVPDQPAPANLDWDMWLGPCPWVPYNRLRAPWNFRWFMEYAGGYMTDWGAHMISEISWAMGTDETGPVAVEGTGVQNPDSFWDVPAEVSLTYTFEDPDFVMTWEQPGDGGRGGPEFGMQYIGTEATLTEFFGSHKVERGDPDLSPTRPDEIHLYESNDHFTNWLECIATRKRPIVDVEIGHRMTLWCHLGNIAYITGRTLRWDPVREVCLGDEDANRLLHKAYREPWHLPA